jgi:molybdopterin-guanine dinucleotide biosynthesis protein A
MGTDKGLIEWNGRILAQHALEKFSALNINVLLSVNEHNYSNYAAYFSASLMVVDNTEINVGGPLKGLLSVHQKLPEEALLVLAVDMPLMHSSVLMQLVEVYEKNDNDAVVFQNEKGVEPLCALYAAAGLCKLSNMLAHNSLTRFSMHHVLSQLNTRVLDMEERLKPFFTNFNHPEDLARLGL